MITKQVSELSSEQRTLVENAQIARSRAQAPYSHFHVGACVLSENGTMSLGCNVETATYTQTSHAEQVGIVGMVANHGSFKIKAIAVAGAPQGSEPTVPCWPCGHCRQIIWENCDDDSGVEIMTLVGEGNVCIATIGELFPMPFGPADLGVKVI